MFIKEKFLNLIFIEFFHEFFEIGFFKRFYFYLFKN